MGSPVKFLRIGFLVLVAALIVGQFIRIEKTNPSTRNDASLDASVKPILQRACYNCHSNETVWPWYSNVAPVSWLVGSDVKEARHAMNFSEWGDYPADVQSHMRKHMVEEIEEGAMPPWYYSMMHSAARLKQEDRDKIKSWATANAAAPEKH